MSYSISQVAKMMGVTPSTLRYYDQEGLLPHIKRVNGMRVFEDEDFRWLRVLNCLKNTKMPIKKIRKYVELAQKGDETLQERYQLIQEQKEYILSQIQEYQYYLQEIEYKEWYYKTAVDAGTEQIHLIPRTFRYNQETAQKFITKIDKMSVMEKELFEIEKTNSNNSD